MTGMSHLKYMLLGGGALFVVLLALGVAPQSAVFLAIALACPLMMVFMMGGHSGHDTQSRGQNVRSDQDVTSPGRRHH
jgi:hypothetical protein